MSKLFKIEMSKSEFYKNVWRPDGFRENLEALAISAGYIPIKNKQGGRPPRAICQHISNERIELQLEVEAEKPSNEALLSID